MRHFEESIFLDASVEEIFKYADDHANFSSHMNNSSWMMGGGKMETQIDKGKGQSVGSHIKMSGKVFGIKIYLDEVITIYKPPYHKEWQTVGDINLLIIDQYKLGFEINPQNGGSFLKVYIDYGLPKSAKTQILGYMFGGYYAKWCVEQMIKDSKKYFSKIRP